MKCNMHGLLRLALLAIITLSVNAYAEDGAIAPEPKKTIDKHFLAQLPTDNVMGKADAPVTMIEYASLTCPHCAHFETTIFPEIQHLYIDTGKVKFIYRDFPLDDGALKAAIITHCADKSRYYTFLKVLFDKQSSWSMEKNYIEILTDIAKLGGMGGDKIDGCLKDKALETSIVESKLSAANNLNITSTPTFFINGEEHKGAGEISVFKEVLDKAIAASTHAAVTK